MITLLDVEKTLKNSTPLHNKNPGEIRYAGTWLSIIRSIYTKFWLTCPHTSKASFSVLSKYGEGSAFPIGTHSEGQEQLFSCP